MAIGARVVGLSMEGCGALPLVFFPSEPEYTVV